jgi:putative transposase
MRMRDLAAARPRFGYQRIHLMLRREGRVVNRKKVLRIYREEGLAVRTRRRHKLAARLRVPMPVPLGPREQWSIDFVTDALVEGRRIRVLTVIDNYTRECLALEVAGSLPSPAVTAALDRAISRYGKPNVITCDNGPEFTANHFDAWAYARGIKIDFIAPGKPIQNALCESFNGSFRDECLNASWFQTLVQARHQIESWRRDYNEARPHSSIGDITPTEYVAQLLCRVGGLSQVKSA